MEIKLLNNASIDATTLRQCKLSLIEAAKARESDTLQSDSVVTVNEQNLSQINNIVSGKAVQSKLSATPAARR